LLRTTADAQLGCLYVHTSAQVEHYVGFLPYVPGLLETATRHVHINIRVIFVQLFKASCNCPLQHIKTWLCQSDDHISYPDQAYWSAQIQNLCCLIKPKEPNYGYLQVFSICRIAGSHKNGTKSCSATKCSFPYCLVDCPGKDSR
jgi:hypothetical protein